MQFLFTSTQIYKNIQKKLPLDSNIPGADSRGDGGNSIPKKSNEVFI